jgi:uncharacterized protein
MDILRESAYISVPWKNGGGLTQEIHREPPDTEVFDWRLSLATIDAHGPFSAFDGYARTLVLVRGAGVELEFGQHGRVRLDTIGQLAAFDGGWSTGCRPIDGPSSDLNLIVSRDRGEASTRCETISTELVLPTAGWGQLFVCCIRGNVRLTNTRGVVQELAPVDVARCSPADGVIVCRPGATGPARVFIAAVRRRPEV